MNEWLNNQSFNSLEYTYSYCSYNVDSMDEWNYSNEKWGTKQILFQLFCLTYTYCIPFFEGYDDWWICSNSVIKFVCQNIHFYLLPPTSNPYWIIVMLLPPLCKQVWSHIMVYLVIHRFMDLIYLWIYGFMDSWIHRCIVLIANNTFQVRLFCIIVITSTAWWMI